MVFRRCTVGHCIAAAAALAALALGLAGEAGAAAAPSARVRAFFSGHSLLDNPLPDWVELIATSRGETLGWEEQLVLGSPIRVRTKGNDPNAAGYPGYALGKSKSGGRIDVLAELARPTQLAPGEKYQRLVITERNDLLGTIKWENTIEHLRHFHDRLVEQDAHASTLLYQVWPDIDKTRADAWLAYVEREIFVWECVAERVNQTLAADGRSDRIGVVPGGLALAELVKRALAGGVPGIEGARAARLDAIFGDEVHLNPVGVYLLAAVHYAALFGKSPVGAAGPPSVNAAALPVLQQIAWDTVSGYRARAAHPPSLAECGKRIANEACPEYYRLSGKPERVAGCKSWAEPDAPFAPASPVGGRVPEAGVSKAAFVGLGGLAAALAALFCFLFTRRAPR
jgi:hypothetical protein